MNMNTGQLRLPGVKNRKKKIMKKMNKASENLEGAGISYPNKYIIGVSV